MIELERVKEQVQELTQLVHTLVGEAVKSLDEASSQRVDNLAPQEVVRRFAAAAKALRGEDEVCVNSSAAKDEESAPTLNKRNLLYFEAKSMQDLHSALEEWQNSNNKRLLSTSIQRDGDNFCCIALSNPTEVVITSADGRLHVDVEDRRPYGGVNRLYASV